MLKVRLVGRTWDRNSHKTGLFTLKQYLSTGYRKKRDGKQDAYGSNARKENAMAFSRTVAIMSYLYEYEDAVNVDVHCLYLFPDITFV